MQSAARGPQCEREQSSVKCLETHHHCLLPPTYHFPSQRTVVGEGRSVNSSAARAETYTHARLRKSQRAPDARDGGQSKKVMKGTKEKPSMDEHAEAWENGTNYTSIAVALD